MLYLAIIFLSAFLLFQVQPFIAKLILPLFGGGAAVWTACLLFFQAFLLLGYFYAHCLTQLKSIKQQLIIHAFLLLISCLFLPIAVSEMALSTEIVTRGQSPLMEILLLLSISIGLPYFVLSSTGPLIQRWLTFIEVGKLPYQLYSLSNVGSLLALLSFPFIVEPLLTSSSQSFIWSIGYVVFTALIMALMVKMLRLNILLPQATACSSQMDNKVDNGGFGQVDSKVDSKGHEANKSITAPSLGIKSLWLALSAVGVILLVSTTNAMTQNIPPVPFLWILPLCLYLLTFIICFHHVKWYVRTYWFALFALTSILAMLMYFIGSSFDIVSQVVIYGCILFIACMICHGELALLKPKADHLTLFYLLLALGGFLGSAFVAFIAQNIFHQFLEFPLAIISVAALLALSLLFSMKDLNKKPNKELKKEPKQESTKQSKALLWASVSLAIFMSFALWLLNQQYVETNVTSERNFYGILSVKDVDVNGNMERRLIDGTTSHGTQSLVPNKTHIPLSYYRKNTGVALAIKHMQKLRAENKTFIHAGFVGLGAGTLAAYGHSGDTFTFYELNPTVVSAANNYFTYLSDSQAKVNIVVGDGRVSLQGEEAKKSYDLLVIDAFSGDSIPQHLLTKEALDLYWRHIKDDGVLAIHISNTHLDLAPIVMGLAKAVNKRGLFFNTKASQEGEHDALWALITDNQRIINHPLVKAYQSPWPKQLDKDGRVINNAILWTDDHSDLLSILK
jgi:hypothetical protein